MIRHYSNHWRWRWASRERVRWPALSTTSTFSSLLRQLPKIICLQDPHFKEQEWPMPTCQPRFSEASELCRFSVVESGPMMTDNCQLHPIRKCSKYRVGSKKTNLLSILACRSCNNVGSTLHSVSVYIFITPDRGYPYCSDWLPPWPSEAAAKKRLRDKEDKEKFSVRPQVLVWFFKDGVEVEWTEMFK